MTRESDPSDSWPRHPQNAPPTDSGIQDNNRHLPPGETSDDAAYLAQVAEAALAPGEIGESPDDPAGRLRAEQLMVEAINAEGLGGDLHVALENELIRYAVPVLSQLLADGRIISKCITLGRPPGDSLAWQEFTPADREELARDMVADALPVFTEAVFVARKWSPDPDASRKTATLKTYFVNACVLQFTKLYREWIKRRRVQPAGLLPDLGIGEAARDPSEIVEIHDEVIRLLSSIPDPQIRDVLALRAMGYTLAEAARRVGLTKRVAENRLARIKRALRKKPEPATEDGGVQ